ncbi:MULTISPECIES: class III lanthionine synthetase LanKC [Streptomyces]|uniref:class III lanthionine synthetase LanKC n=1 Tax=Streptomyces TaxID=1883 RepID=UPI00163C443B|nr:MULTISPECIES: class III lanthionine synthetase LanKC [Streptomyces]MBC2879092.1 protein kinase/lanthionine synthetase C family protein [Streptomyces sp. TYQ1024]UBI36055.1 class III lanthionine synthetase LanKC [Streptomyces mobaraensis]UKW28649.1 class III lanthionine synthetase LanKC [Streptomyces sp. TYQ1024]
MHDWELLNAYARYHPRWFESADAYTPATEHTEVFEKLAPPGWALRRSGLWFVAEPSGDVAPTPAPAPEQGWKIHVAVRSQDSPACLERAAGCALDAAVPFKFLLDARTVAEVNGKLWPRGSSGKFMTFYPPDDGAFLRLGHLLTDELRGFDGPYILSDRRWPRSSCVYYRYGGFSARALLRPDGSRRFVIADQRGAEVPDARLPYWQLPEWLTDPLVPDGPPGRKTGTAPELHDGRYRVTSALNFSNRGGVYLADDRSTGRFVVLKEARPHIEVGPGRLDAVGLLEKEYRILRDLSSDCEFYVRPLGLFEEGGHTFLVEEYLPGEHLGRHTIRKNPLYRAGLTRAALDGYYAGVRPVWERLARAIGAAHRRGVVLGDLSFGNVIVPDSGGLRVIDLECAVEEGVDPPVGLHTPGMALPEAVRSGVADRANDLYALGAVVFGSVVLANAMTELYAPSRRRFLTDLTGELGLSGAFVELLDALMERPEAGRAPDIDDVIAALDTVPVMAPAPVRALDPASDPATGHPAPHPSPGPPRHDTRELARETRSAALRYLERTATPEREDRLFPADPSVFETNPLSVAYGAAGVLHTLHRAGGADAVPPRLTAWMTARSITDDAYPPGLYLGQAGIAWVLRELDRPEAAVELLRRAGRHPLRDASADVLHGLAGYGTACLRFWLDGFGEDFLDAAARAGERLAETRVRGPRGPYWPDAEGNVPLGYAAGGSGIALFLLCLSQATHDERAYALGHSALEHDLTYAVRHGTEFEGFPAMVPLETEADTAIVPRCYWDFGSAGILTTLIRYLAVRPDDGLGRWLDPLVENVHHKYAVLPQFFHGLSGMGNALLDVWRFTGDPRYREAAWKVAEGVLLFRVDSTEGTGFPGEQALRESADFATGTAGVVAFLDRLIRADTDPDPAQSPDFVVDDLIPLPAH